jgi:arylsulfatase A-like enzyme
MNKRKNIIVIVADDHRCESLGCNGNAVVSTPHLDALAASGTRFTGAHCQGSMHPAVCVPSRASLLTGRNIFASSADPTGRDYEGSAFAIPEDLATFPQMLRSQGYHTHAVGKWHNDKASFTRSFVSGSHLLFGGMSDHDRVPLSPFDPTGAYSKEDIYFESDFSTDLFRSGAETFLREYRQDAPFCLYLAFTAPHDPRTPPPHSRVSTDGIELPENYLPIHPFDNGEMLVRDELLEDFPRSPDAIRQHIADYYGMISHLDDAIGSLLQTMAQTGHAEDTIVVYTADHGLALGQHGLLGKQNLYNHSLRIPLIIAGPGIPRGRQIDDLVWHADTHATILSLMGHRPASGCEGINQLPAADARAAVKRETLTAVYRFGQRMIRNERYKLIRYYKSTEHNAYAMRDGTATPGSEVEQLFDLETDPLETVNLASLPDMQAVRKELRERLHRWQVSVHDPILVG